MCPIVGHVQYSRGVWVCPEEPRVSPEQSELYTESREKSAKGLGQEAHHFIYVLERELAAMWGHSEGSRL